MLPPAGALAYAVSKPVVEPECQEERHEQGNRAERLGNGAEDDERKGEAHEVEAVRRAGIEALLGDDDARNEVTGGLAVRARVAHALDAHLVAVVRSRGDVDDDLARGQRAPRPAACLAGVGDDLAGPLALRALHVNDAEAQKAAKVEGDTPAAAAGRAGLWVLCVNGAGAVAHVAGGVALVGHAPAAALRGLIGIQVDLEHDVGAGTGIVRARLLAAARARVEPAAEGAPGEGAAHAAERVAVSARARRAVAGARAGERVAGAHGVVALALVLIGEHGIGLGDLLELLLGVRLFIDVRVKLARLLLEGLSDLLGRGVLLDAEDGVVVFVVHRGHVAGLPVFWRT